MTWRRSIWLVCALVFALLGLARKSEADSFVFTTQPDPGNVSGTAGSTIGWGYSITNTSATDFLSLMGIDSTLFLSSNGTPDASIFDFPVLAPGQTVTVGYDPLNFLGLFEFTWNPGVPVGTTESGTFTLSAQYCDASLVTCGDIISESADFSASVSPEQTATPEPASLNVLLIGFAALTLFRRRACRP